MQIFEVTSKKRVDEINLGATVKAVGSAISNRALSAIGQAAGVSGAEYAAAMTQKPGLTGDAAQAAAAKAAAPIIQQQAKAAQAAWKNQMAAMVRSAGGDYSQLDMQQKTYALDKFVTDQLLGGRVADFRRLPNQIDPASFGGKGVQLAKQTVANIEAAMNAVLALDPIKTPTATQIQAWQQLATQTYNATNQATFQPGSGAAPAQKTAAAQPAAADPRAAAMMAAMGLDAADLGKMNAPVNAKGRFKGRLTGDPYLDSMLRAAKLI